MNSSDTAKAYQRKRRLMYGANALILTVSVIGLLVLAYVAIEPLHWRLDLTANRDLSLAPQTESVLQSLTQPVVVRAFFRKGGDLDQVYIRRKVDDVLRLYAAQSAQIDYQLLDPDLHVEEAISFGIRNDGTIVFQTGNRRKDIGQSLLFTYPSLHEEAVPQFVGESLFTNALLDITQGEPTYVCFLAGHGERKQDHEEDGLSELTELLGKSNYLMQEISLEQDRGWRDLCGVLIIAGPRLGLHSAEDEAILEYLNSGKKILLMVDPQSEIGLSQTLAALGVSLHDSVVFDPNRHFVLGAHYPAPRLLEHEITAPLTQQQLTPIFYLARPLIRRTKDLPAGLSTAEFLSTSPLAWGETDPKAQEEAQLNAGVDLAGPVTLAVAVSKEAPTGSEQPSAVVFGDSNFVTNKLLEIPGNRDLFLNSLAWLVGQQAQIAIRPQQTDFRPLLLSPVQARWASVWMQLLFPGAILGGGLSYWWRRRRRWKSRG